MAGTRLPPTLAVERIEAPYLGYDGDSAPNYASVGRGVAVMNMLPGRAGLAGNRGPIIHAWSTGGPTRGPATWSHNDDVLAIAADNAGIATIGGYSVNMQTGVNMPMTNATGATDFSPQNYAQISSSNTVGLVNVGPGLTACSLARYDSAITTLTLVANTPFAGTATALCHHLGRVFVSVGNTVSPALYWSDVSGPTHDLLTDWQDDFTGLTNKIVMTDDADPIVALRSMSGRLIIFRRGSIWALAGSTPASFSLRKVADADVLEQHIVTHNDRAYFEGAGGRMFVFDGVRATPLPFDSADVIHVSDPPMAFVGAYVLTRRHMFHEPTGSRVAYTVSPDEVIDGGRTTNHAYAVTQRSHADPLYIYDVSAVGSENVSVAAEPLGAGGTAFPTIGCTARQVRLGTPTLKAQMHRIVVEYSLYTGGGGDAQWVVSAADSRGNPILADTALPSDTSPTGPRRFVIDCFAEVDEIQVSYRLGMTSGVANDARIYDTYVEYQYARPTTS